MVASSPVHSEKPATQKFAATLISVPSRLELSISVI